MSIDRLHDPRNFKPPGVELLKMPDLLFLSKATLYVMYEIETTRAAD